MPTRRRISNPGRIWTPAAAVAALGLALAACGGPPAPPTRGTIDRPPARVIVVRDTTIAAVLEASGVAEPIQRATLSTRLMGSVTSMHVLEGQRVRTGQLLARVDARELSAKRAQVEAGIAEAEAVRQDALTQAQRFRALYADSAATRAQLDAAEIGLARADAGVRTARAAARELQAVSAYAELEAPFRGVVTRRFVDPGAFVAPGAPIVVLEDPSMLRIRVTVAPDATRGLSAGTSLEGTIERVPISARVEGVAPLATGALYTVNALVANPDGKYPSGGAATLRVPRGSRVAVLVPADALVREGDLTGVRVRTASGSELRWVRPGSAMGEQVEVLSGLRSGERVELPSTAEGGS